MKDRQLPVEMLRLVGRVLRLHSPHLEIGMDEDPLTSEVRLSITNHRLRQTASVTTNSDAAEFDEIEYLVSEEEGKPSEMPNDVKR